MPEPVLTIITPTLNRAPFLEEAIRSVLSQNVADVEHIVIDAMSTDGTAEMLTRYPHLHVIREPDAGLYDGINKGLRLARGQVVGLLNSDDLYAAGALAAVLAAFREPEVEVVTGGAEFFLSEADGRERVLSTIRGREALELSLHNVLLGVALINARFFRRELAARTGAMDLRFRIAADREFLLRMAFGHPRETILPVPVYRYRQHAGSLTINGQERSAATYRAEHVEVAEKHLASAGLAAADRRILRTFHSRESAALAVRALQSGQWRGAASWMRRGCAVQATWPVAFGRWLGGDLWQRCRGTHRPAV